MAKTQFAIDELKITSRISFLDLKRRKRRWDLNLGSSKSKKKSDRSNPFIEHKTKYIIERKTHRIEIKMNALRCESAISVFDSNLMFERFRNGSTP